MNIKHYIRIELNSAEKEAYNTTYDWLASLTRSSEITGDVEGIIINVLDALDALDDFLDEEG